MQTCCENGQVQVHYETNFHPMNNMLCNHFKSVKMHNFIETDLHPNEQYVNNQVGREAGAWETREDVREESGARTWGTWEGGIGIMGEAAALARARAFASAESASGLARLPDRSPPA
jgi:hypothetical protein